MPTKAVAAAVVGLLATGLFIGCGGSDPSDAATGGTDEQKVQAPVRKGPVYHLELAGSELETQEQVGKTYRLKLGWQNTGENRVPMLAVTFSTTDGWAQAEDHSGLSRSPAFATPEGPVWQLMSGYPRIAGTSERAGTTTDGKTFTLGPLAPGQRRLTIWKLKALAPGPYSLRHEAVGDLGEDSVTKSIFDAPPQGFYELEIAPRDSGA